MNLFRRQRSWIRKQTMDIGYPRKIELYLENELGDIRRFAESSREVCVFPVSHDAEDYANAVLIELKKSHSNKIYYAVFNNNKPYVHLVGTNRNNLDDMGMVAVDFSFLEGTRESMKSLFPNNRIFYTWYYKRTNHEVIEPHVEYKKS